MNQIKTPVLMLSCLAAALWSAQQILIATTYKGSDDVRWLLGLTFLLSVFVGSVWTMLRFMLGAPGPRNEGRSDDR